MVDIGRLEVCHKSALPSGSYMRLALIKEGESLICNRCGSVSHAQEFYLPYKETYYCPQCIHYGRLTTEDYLVWNEQSIYQPRKINFQWKGVLTVGQQKVADRIITNYQSSNDSLIWAVTGSGKTEMIFPLIKHALKSGGRVAVCSPRIDVCRELFPRIAEAFPNEQPLLLHGNSEENYRFCFLTICTMHQLLYFYHAFDLLIIDEADAFPYEGDTMLMFASKNALKENGRMLFLTATPSKFLLNHLSTNTEILKLPRRYHGRPLPVPKLVWQNNWSNCQHFWFKRKLVELVDKLIEHSFVLIFCPSILYMHQLYKQLVGIYGEQIMTTVHSEDPNRKEKVQLAREKSFKILITSTILERGVTFEQVSVIVIGANHRIYTKSCLVQIAGRVDRKGNQRNGEIYFIFNRKTTAMREAIYEIKWMNQLALEERRDGL